jgi:hypothetical protein
MPRRAPNSSRPPRPTSTLARRKGIPLTPLARRMLHDLQLAGHAERTHESYLRAVRKFAQWLNKSPDVATEDELRRYLPYIKNDQLWDCLPRQYDHGHGLRVGHGERFVFWSSQFFQRSQSLPKS